MISLLDANLNRSFYIKGDFPHIFPTFLRDCELDAKKTSGFSRLLTKKKNLPLGIIISMQVTLAQSISLQVELVLTRKSKAGLPVSVPI